MYRVRYGDSYSYANSKTRDVAPTELNNFISKLKFFGIYILGVDKV